VLRQLPQTNDPDLLAGSGDDAAVYRIDDELALVSTVDFFPPIVDDPYSFGQIAAANALSDVYAMGGRPMTALNIVGFPVGLPKDILVSVLRGGADKAGEAGVLIVGGHTVDDDEPKYGLAVTGVVKPGEQVTTEGARVGDALILTKPIGTGVITTAGKQQRVEQDVLDDAVEVMSALNAEASRVMIDVGVHACTDITGFGLLGHLRTVLEPSRVAAVVHYEAVPLLRGAWDLAAQGVAPGGTGRNVESVADVTAWPDGLDDVWTVLLCDAQTSGGLLISVSPDKSEQLLTGLTDAGVGVATVVGEIVPADSLDGKLIAVRP
jgi:selenide,water dikinase